LENCLRRAVLVCKGDVLLAEHVHFEGGDQTPDSPGADAAARSLEERVDALVTEILDQVGGRAHASLIDLVEKSLIARALQACGYNQVRTARLLGISRNTLRHRMQKYHLESPGNDPSLSCP
jgi:DNA-binding NtrC family response regulator